MGWEGFPVLDVRGLIGRIFRKDNIPLALAIGSTVGAIAAATGAGVLPWLRGQPVEYNPELAVLTLTLVAIIWYTYFTYGSTVLARESLEYAIQLDEEEHARLLDRLSPRIAMLRQSVEALPSGQPDHQLEILNFNLWQEKDVTELEEWCGRLGPYPTRIATDTATALRSLYSTISHAQEANRRGGALWDTYDWNVWTVQRAIAEKGLDELVNFVSASRAVKLLGHRYPRRWEKDFRSSGNPRSSEPSS